MRLVIDLEANGLLYDASRIHCLVTKDVDTGEIKQFRPSEVEQGLRFAMQAELLVGHNVIAYDLALASRLYPWFGARYKVTDTLVLSRFICANLSDQDFARQGAAAIDPALRGSHSLKAWGQRLGFEKADYQGGFDEFSEEMLSYNVRDVEVTERLWRFLLKHEAYSEKADQLEHAVQWIAAKQEQAGFSFDVTGAEKLTGELSARRHALEKQLQDTFPPWEEEVGEFIPKVNNAQLGYVKGVPVLRKKTIEFNPGSRHHIANRLKAIHGWSPSEYTPDGSAKVDEAVLSKLPYPEAKLLTEYLMVQKRLGMLSDGNNAWLKLVRNGKIHGEVLTNGAVTGRATHRNPNIAQVPAVGVPYGQECRSLFRASSDRVLVGVDVSGLELRLLAHFMHTYDNGAYAKEVVSGDVHTTNQKAAGLTSRAQAKTFIYALIYGAGPAKIGSIIGKGPKDGAQLRSRFLAQTPALGKLLSAIEGVCEHRNYLNGLDGRRLFIRSSHSAANTLIQSAGALICKQWLVQIDRMIPQVGWQHKVQQLAWIHDEAQFECDPDIAEEFGKRAVACIQEAADEFKIKVPLTGEYKVGRTWADTH